MTVPDKAALLHGVTLKAMIEHLVDRYGWDGLGKRIEIRCFTHDPSVTSSLRFLRKTPWAREPIIGLPTALNTQMGARVFLVGPADRAPEAFGVLRKP